MSLTEIKIIEPIKTYLKEFETPDEFNLFYTKNKDEIDKLTTHKLNKLYHIKGYRITRIKEILMLKKYNEKPKDEKNTDVENNDELSELKNKVNQIIEFLHSNQISVQSDYRPGTRVESSQIVQPQMQTVASDYYPQTHTVVSPPSVT